MNLTFCFLESPEKNTPNAKPLMLELDEVYGLCSESASMHINTKKRVYSSILEIEKISMVTETPCFVADISNLEHDIIENYKGMISEITAIKEGETEFVAVGKTKDGLPAHIRVPKSLVAGKTIDYHCAQVNMTPLYTFERAHELSILFLSKLLMPNIVLNFPINLKELDLISISKFIHNNREYYDNNAVLVFKTLLNYCMNGKSVWMIWTNNYF